MLKLGLIQSIIGKTGIIIAALALVACAQTSPKHEAPIDTPSGEPNGAQIFESTFLRHGGKHLASLNDVNVGVDGDWYYLITKIQPEVTDEDYRQQSQERILSTEQIYAAHYTGSAGTKRVFRSPDKINVAYNSNASSDPIKEGATALTADAFYLFVLGPLALQERVNEWQRIEDGVHKGKAYYRINGELTPGIGLSSSDYITLWVDKQSELTFRMHITLDGFESTKGAHVDTTFLQYTEIDQFTLPTHFFERVLGPIRIDAHEWWYTGIDINRGLAPEDLNIEEWSDKATIPAAAFEGRSQSQ